MGWVVITTPRPLYPRERPGNRVYRRLRGPQGRSGQVWKISPPPGFDPRIVQSVASRYTDWAIAALRSAADCILIRLTNRKKEMDFENSKKQVTETSFFFIGRDLRKSVERCFRVNGLWGWASGEWDYEECHMEGSGRIRVEPRSLRDVAWVPGSRSLF